MSDTRLGISINATDSASAVISRLETTVKSLEATLAQLGALASNASSISVASINREIEAVKGRITAINVEIAARKQQIETVTTSVASLQQADTATVKFRSTLEGINVAFGLNDRAIKSASDSARILATSLSAAADADERLRIESQLTTSQLTQRDLILKNLAQSKAGRSGAVELPLAGRVVDTRTAGYRQAVDELLGVNHAFDKASASAAVFAKAEASVAEKAMVAAEAQRSAALAASNLAEANARAAVASFSGRPTGPMPPPIPTATAAVAASGRAGTASVAGLASATSGTAALNREARHAVALFDEMARGQRGAMFSTIGAAARDAGFGIGAMSTSIIGLIAVMGVMHIARQAEELGKWAAELKAGASAAGMSVSAYSGLQAALTSVGLKATEADSSLHFLARSMSTALEEPASKAAQAFRNMGISEEQLANNGTSVIGMLRLLADAHNATADNANKSANEEEIFGRGFERLLPLLDGGKAKLDDVINKQKEFGRVIDKDGADKLEHLGQKVGDVGRAISSGAIPAFIAWAPVIERISEVVIKLIDVLSTAITKMGELASQDPTKFAAGAFLPRPVASAIDLARAAMGLPQMLSQRRLPGPRVETALPPDAGEFPSRTPATKREVGPLLKGETITPLEQMRLEVAQAKELAAQGAANVRQLHIKESAAEIAVMQRTLVDAKLTAVQRNQVETDLANKNAMLRQENLSNAAYGQASILELMRVEAAKAAELASRGAKDPKLARQAEAAAEISVMQQTLQTAKLTSLQRAELETALAHKQITLRNEQLSASGGAGKQATRDFIAEGKLKIAEANGNANAIAAIYDEMLAHLKASHTATAAQIATIEREKVNAVNRAVLDGIKEQTKQEEQGNRLLILNSRLAAIAGGTAKFQGQGQSEGPGMDLARSKQAIADAEEVRNRAAMRIQELEQVRDTSVQGTTIRKEAEQEITNVVLDAKTKEVALYNEAGNAAVAAATKIAAPFKTLFDSMGNQMEQFGSSVLTALLAPQQEVIKAGLTSIKVATRGDEIRNAAKTLFMGIANDLMKSVQTAVGHALASAISGGTANSIGELLGNLLSKAVGSVFGSAAGSALGNVAGSAAGGATSSVAISTAVTAAGATTVAGISGAIATSATAQTAAIATSATAITGAIATSTAVISGAVLTGAANPEIMGFKFSGGGVVPSAAGGMTVGGTGATLAILHAKEMVLPAPISQGIQNMISNGGGNTSSNSANLNYSPTINAQGRGRGGTGMSRSEFAQMMALHSGAMLGEARNMVRSGWRPA